MKILFISHEASRTGAPFVLLYFLQWLKEYHSEIHLSVLSLYGGYLSDEFKKVADDYYDFSKIKNPKQNFLKRIRNKSLKKLGLNYCRPDAKEIFLKNLSLKDFDLIYSNTTVSLPISQRIKLLNKNSKLILHVHELESEIKRTIGNFENVAGDIDKIIAASAMVRDNLIINHQLPAKKIKVVYEFTKQLSSKNKTIIKDGVFHVGGAGKFSYRKGTDLFIQVARYINDNYRDLKIEFTWVGLVSENDKMLLKLELIKLNLNLRLNFIGEVEDPELYFKNFDVFLMTSREDPFPLVCIEAGMLGIPIICFENASGISEIIQDKGGFIVPYINIEAMAEKILFYIKNKQIWRAHSQFNQKEFSKFTAKDKGKEIYRLLEKSIKK